MTRNLYRKNRIIHQITIILAALLLAYLLPAQALAHDANITSPEGLVAPSPPELPTPSEQQILYRIDPLQSQAQYSVQDVYVGGIDGKLVVGQTSGIAGNVLIDWGDLANSQLGMITVNVEQLTSDSSQRDRQIRKSYLESSLYPEAVFIPEAEQKNAVFRFIHWCDLLAVATDSREHNDQRTLLTKSHSQNHKQ